MEICFKEITVDELQSDMLQNFNRYQYVENDWYPDENGGYYLVHQPHTENWDDSQKVSIVDRWRLALNNGGKSFCAYDGQKLVGFIFIDGTRLGSEKQYVELVYFHVSYEYRGNGIGKRLFHLCAEAVLQNQCKKICIVASSSEESQKAYHKLGCTYVKERIPHLHDKRPDDVHMEFIL